MSKVYYIAVYRNTSTPVIESGRVPIFWRKKVAVGHFKEWKNVKIVRCTVDIWPK